jgi:hypothetical protein
MLRLFEGVAAAVSVVLFLSWLIATPTSLPFDHSPFATRYSPFAAVLPVANRHLLPFPSCCFFVVANSHSNNLPVANRHLLSFPSCCFFVVANSHSNNLPVANRQSPVAAVQFASRYSLLAAVFAGGTVCGIKSVGALGTL